MKYITSIIICLIITASATAQVKFTQLERSATQWNIPVAKRVVPGISDYVMTYMTLADLIDSTELVLGTRIDSMNMTTNDTLALYTSDGVFKTKIVITHPSDSTVVENDYGTIIVESPANTFGVTVDSSKYTSVYQNSLKQNLITGTSGQTLRFSGTNTLAANSLLYNNGTNIGIGTVAPTSKLHLFTATGGAFHAQTEDPGASCFVLQNTNASFNNSLIYMPVTRAATTAYRFFDARAAGTEQFWIKGNGDFYSKGAFFDATNSAGTSGQVLSSTVTGTDWIDLPAGDITAVTVSAPVTGSSLSGPIPNIAVDTTDATAAALATQFDLLGKQATLVSGTNIKTVNSNSLVGSGNVSVGTVTSITAAAPLTGGAITTSGTIGVDTTATTGSALATQFDISTKWTGSGSGTSGQATYWNGTSSIAGSPNFLWTNADSMLTTRNLTVGRRDLTATTIAGWSSGGVATGMTQGHGITISGGTLRSSRFTVDGTNWFSGDLYFKTENVGTSPAWVYAGGDVKFRMPAATNGQVLKSNGTNWIVGTDNDTDTDAQNLTTPSWNTGTGVLTTGISGGSGTTIDLDGRYLTAEVDGSTTNEIQSLSYNTGTRALGISSGGGVTLPLVSSTIAGLVSAYPNNTTSFLRGDGTWATPPTPAVTGTAPIVVTSGNISLNIGTGLYSASGSLTNLSTNYGYLFHSSGTIGGQSISTTPLTVNFNDQMQGFNMTCNTSSDYVQVTNSGGYEIDYGVCVGGISSTRQISVQVYVGSSSVPGTLKRFFIDSGDEDCAQGKHVMDLTAGQQVFLKVATSGSETATFDGPQLKVTRIY